MTTRADEVVEFWLGGAQAAPFSQAEKWWRKDPALDAEIRDRFGALHAEIIAGGHTEWKDTPRTLLGYLIVLDQFSRNMFRDDPKAFAHDIVAQRAALAAVERGLDRELTPEQRIFSYMPFMHAEDRALQDRSVLSFATLVAEAPEEIRDKLHVYCRYAVLHRNIVVRFGRYPHRNAILGRPSTADEIAFLKEPGSSF